jgi:hypothetical protein
MTQIGDDIYISLKEPFAKQLEALALVDAEAARVLMLGGVGSGKSALIALWIIGESLAHPGNLGCVVRRTYEELKDTTHVSFLEECPPEFISHKTASPASITYFIRPLNWLGDEGELSQIQFRSTFHAGKQDANKFKSLNLGWVAIEEASEIDEQVYLMLLSRLRRLNSSRSILCASNPPNQKHWMWKYWNKDVPLVGVKEGHKWVRSRTSDNPHLPVNYEAELRANYPPSWIRRYLDAEVGFLTSGQGVFENEFQYSIHVKECDIDPALPIIRSWDIGSSRRPAMTWHQFVPFNKERPDMGQQWRVLAERYSFDKSLSEFVTDCLTYQARFLPTSYHGEIIDACDPAGNARDIQTQMTAIDVLGNFGIKGVRYATDRLRNGTSYRVEIVRSWLLVRDKENPSLIIRPSCPTTIDGLSGGYQYPSNRTSGEPVESPLKDGLYDGLMDSLQYCGVNFCAIDRMLVDPASIKKQTEATLPVGFVRGRPLTMNIFAGSARR